MRNEFLYKHVYEGIREKILNGEFQKDSKLPSEKELCIEYDVSAITVKKAMDLLVDEGLVRRVPGKGTYVIDHTAAEKVSPREEEVKEVEKYEKLESEARDKKRRLLGVVLEHVASPFGLDMLYQLDYEAEKAGYKLCIRFSYGSREKETDEIEHLMALNVEGLIIMPCHGSHYNNAILKLIVDDFPVILIDKRMTGISVSTVSTDGKNAVRLLVKHLYERGCRNIGLITMEASDTTSLIDRREGFFCGLEEYKLPLAGECVLKYDHTDFIDKKTEQIEVDMIRQFFEKTRGSLDGVVCTEYGIMSSVVKAAKSLGVNIGSDLKICCIDEDYQAADGYFFTHMKQDEREIAKLALKLLIQGGKQPAVDYVVPAIFRQGRTT